MADWHSLSIDEKLLRFILPSSAILAMVSLFLTSSYRTMIETYLFGVVISIITAVPDWPYFYRSPLSWHEPLGIDPVQPRQTTSTKKLVKSIKKLAPLVLPHSSLQGEVPYRLSSFQSLPSSTSL